MSLTAYWNLRGLAVVVSLLGACAIWAGPAWGATAEVDTATNTLVVTGTADGESTQVDHSLGFWVVHTAAQVGGPPQGTTPLDGCQSINSADVRCNGAVANVYYDGGDGQNNFSLTTPSSKILGSIELYGGADRDSFGVLAATGDVYAELGGGPDGFDVSQAHIPAVEVYGEAGNDDLGGSHESNDILNGGADGDRVEGYDGADQIDLGPGNDVGEGDEGDDVIRGGPGNDKLAGGADHDDLYGDAGQDEFGADHDHNTGFALITISGPNAQMPGDDRLFLREPQPEQDLVYEGTFSNPSVTGGCAGGDDYVETDSLDVVPLNVGCETIDRPGTPASLTLTPTAQEFGSIQVGFGSIVRAFTLTNDGDLPSAAVGTALGGPNANQFVISLSDCPQGQPLPGHTFCTVGVRFFPTSTGAKAATLTVAGLTTPLSGTGHQPSTGGEPTTGTQPDTSQQPSTGQPSAGPPPSADQIAPLIAELTKAVQRIAAALQGKFTATISTNEAGTWKIQVFGQAPRARGAARKALLASRTATISGPGKWRVKVPFKAAAKKSLKRLRVARLEVRSTFTDTSGNKTTDTRKVTLRR
jgi:hypothetical protein